MARSRLSKETRERIDKVADSAATLQLAAEEAARRLTAPVVDRAAERLVVRVSVEGAEAKADAMRAAARSIRAAQEEIEREFTAAMREAREIAREFSMRHLAVEAEPLVGTAEHTLVLTPSLPAAEVEAMWAEQAGKSMARRLGSAAMAETQAWASSGKGPAQLPRALAKVGHRLEPERKLHSVTQSVGAFNEHRRGQWEALKRREDADRERAKPLPGVPMPAGDGGRKPKGTLELLGCRDLWSACLDVKTCPVCWKLDGQMKKPGERFPEGAATPLHNHCRCSEITVFFADELTRYLDGYELDYEAFKEDVRDYMGSRKYDLGPGVKHARRFVDEMFEKRYPNQEHSPITGSALVLTRRVNDRAGYFPNLIRPRAPNLRW